MTIIVWMLVGGVVALLISAILHERLVEATIINLNGLNNRLDDISEALCDCEVKVNAIADNLGYEWHEGENIQLPSGWKKKK